MTTGDKPRYCCTPEAGLTDMRPAFYLYKEQRDMANEWANAHDAEKHGATATKPRYSGAIGGAFTWEFTPTSLGTVSTLKCSCGEQIDVSDYDEW